jgi:hypothetical protein
MRGVWSHRICGRPAAVPSEDGIGFGDKGDLLQGTATEALADLSESGSLGIGKAQSGWKVRSQDAILRDEILILKQELLIDEPGHIRQQSSPLVVGHEEHPS